MVCFPHSWLQIWGRGSHDGPPTTGSAPSHPSVPFPHTSKDSAIIKGGGGLQLLEEGLCPFSGGKMGLGAREYIHVAKAGSWAFSVTPRLSPKWQQWGQPLNRPEVRPSL